MLVSNFDNLERVNHKVQSCDHISLFILESFFKIEWVKVCDDSIYGNCFQLFLFSFHKCYFHEGEILA